jgi:hypothetical protein
LLELSKKCGGWIVCTGATNPKIYHLVPMEKWLAHYNDPDNNPLNIAELYSTNGHPSKFTGIFEEKEFSPLIKRSLLLFDEVILIDIPSIKRWGISSDSYGKEKFNSITYRSSAGFVMDYNPEKYKWLYDKELIKKYEVSFDDAIGSEVENNIFKKYVYFPKETNKMLSKRIASMQLKRLHGIDSYPVFIDSNIIYQSDFTQKSAVLRIVLNKLPIPSDLTSWDEIKEFKENSSNVGRFLALKVLINEISNGTLQPSEIVDKLDYLLYQYENSYKLHNIEHHNGLLEVFVVTPLEIIEDIVKLKWSKLAKSLFSLSKNDISLLKSEINSPGSQVAYIFHAKQHFSK